MTDARDLLVEIGTEELPPKALRRLSEAFGAEVVAGLDAAGLSHGEATLYATPRRMAIKVDGVATAQAERQLERRGPALTAAFDEAGEPTRAALGFARSCGVEVEHLERLETPKGSWLMFRTTEAGQPTASLLPGIVETALGRLPIPKRMRWGALDVEFVRPVHWIVMLLGEDVVDGSVLGVSAGRETRGHRFHHPGTLTIPAPAQYASLLRENGHVLADFDARRDIIRQQVETTAATLEGRAVVDEALLDEVTALVEWPVAIRGGFDEEFLSLPQGPLIATMKGNQRYFHLVDDQGRLLPHFIAISNIESSNPDAVRQGNERVIRPRLADAAFFYRTDLRTPLAERLDTLKNVVFQEKLGSVFDKSQRVANLAAHVATELGGSPDQVELARRAGMLSKCDLVTDMVGEFPELQGYMGREYARHSGEDPAVCQALEEGYMPRFAGDSLPAGDVGRAVAIAERLDTLVGIFGIGQLPKGDKDPFALRRAALGALRMLIEQDLDLDLARLLHTAAAGFGTLFDAAPVAEKVFDFMMERLRAYFVDQGVPAEVFLSVLARRPVRPRDFAQRIRAVDAFRQLPEAESLSAANKRIQNILRQAEGTLPERVDDGLFREDAERTLAARLEELRPGVDALLGERDYTTALTRLAGLRDPVDAFFDGVQVMAEDQDVRGNRLRLLSEIRTLFLATADISRLQG